MKKYPKAHVTAIDYSPLSVEKAGEYNRESVAAGRCVVQQGDVSDLRLPSESFDLATAFEMETAAKAAGFSGTETRTELPCSGTQDSVVLRK